ncbi:DUF6152 family protein [Aurantiacibacter poecillastricola]|uniref:DUF6152 family protein n=1 Tax=Aurantiacibacter poecillastricola TaxID=3064385 RepID=UPI00273D6EFE|nr:DUF6152 family protein [Aurantiacibacter sp. 219JJ12-13]MDP5261226.1 DUF6152 family protein [Aurantiacibacter sp. 219JJ12-13]
MGRILALALGSSLAIAGGAPAHHSFAVYFDPEATVTLEGTVTAFRFTNPHGTLVLDVDGTEWRAETNAPVVLQRRGWTRASLRPGQHVTVSGWRARNGRNYMRIREVRDEGGQMIGNAPFGQDDG